MQTYKQLADEFNDCFRPGIPTTDEPMLSTAWDNYTDSVHTDGDLTALEYHYCPHITDVDQLNTLPADDSAMLEYVLAEMQVECTVEEVAERPAGLMQDSALHWHYTLTRGTAQVSGYFSGGCLGNTPDLPYIVAVLLGAISPDTRQPFEDWARDRGYDEDSRRAERIYNACPQLAPDMAPLFTPAELESLQQRAAQL